MPAKTSVIVKGQIAESSKGKIRAAFKNAGATAEDTVEVNISYDIIRQVSAQLYTNPRKAIEELVCNSYDAGATECWVKLPKNPEDALFVLDNGKSMNLAGVKDLWKVAYSPKVKKEGEPRIDNNRMQVGKFGVGKLAVFALGQRLTHISCVGNTVRLVSVGQSEIKEQGQDRRPTFQIYSVPLNKAKGILEPYFSELPKPWERKWPTWTLAAIEEIELSAVGRALKVGFLKQMITSSLPISSDFKIFLEQEQVPERKIESKDIEVRIEVTDLPLRKKIEETLQAYWKDFLEEENEDDVPAEYYKVKVQDVPDPRNVSEKVKALVVPKLGPVIGWAVITHSFLTTGKLKERGYSNNGFAVYAYGKLINPEDPLFGVTQRSHSYWSRFYARLEIPGLDRVILVQRNAVSEHSEEAQIAREVLRTIFNHARNRAEELEESEGYEPQEFGSRMKMLAPILAPQALMGLAKNKFPKEGLEALKIDFASFGEAGFAAKYDPETNTILINADHPLIVALDDLGSKSKPLRHMIGEVFAGTQMSKGYLAMRGVKMEIVEESSDIIEVAMRSAAGYVRDEVEEHIKVIKEASYEGGAAFENAVVTAFRSMRLSAWRLGQPDLPDGILEIPRAGQISLRISVEAKGSQGIITHKELSEATVSRHREENGCTHAIAIAREYRTEGQGGKDSALVRETQGKVTLMTVDGIVEILRLHRKRPFTYDKIATILTTSKKPNELIPFIHETWKQLPELGLMRLILEVAQEKQNRDSQNYPDPGMILGDDRVLKWKVRREQIIHVLETIQFVTGMLIIRSTPDYQFELLSDTDTILDAMTRAAVSSEESTEKASKQRK